MVYATALVLLLLALLAVPVEFSYRLEWRRGFDGEARLLWLFGLVRFPLTPSREKKRIEAAKKPREKPSTKKLRPLAAIRQKSFRQRLLRFARDSWRAIGKRDLYLRARVGLDDPADTGQLWALLGPLSGWLASLDGAAIELEPEFADAVFELDSGGRISLIPLQLLYLALGLLLSPAFWRGLRQMRAAA